MGTPIPRHTKDVDGALACPATPLARRGHCERLVGAPYMWYPLETHGRGLDACAMLAHNLGGSVHNMSGHFMLSLALVTMSSRRRFTR